MVVFVCLLVTVLFMSIKFERQKRNIKKDQVYILKNADPFNEDNFMTVLDVKRDYVLYGNKKYKEITSTKTDFLTKYTLC